MQPTSIKEIGLWASIRTVQILPAFITGAVLAADPGSVDCTNPSATGSASAGAQCAAPTAYQNTTLFGDGSFFQKIANTLIFLVGAVAVIMLIIGGLRYVISQGDKTNVENAKNTILYAIIGIVVAILAYAIVQYVTGAFGGAASGQ